MNINRLPRGCTNVGGPLAASMDKCRTNFMELFSSFGYRPFWPSALQLLESAWPHLPEGYRQRLIALTTPYGEPSCLRADITLAAVAFLASHYAPEQQPLRLCYADRIFKRAEKHENRIENFQIGAELLGWEGEGADIEILWLLLRWLDEIGLDKSILVIGDVTFLNYALAHVGTAIAERLSRSLLEGNLSEYRNVLSTSDIPEYSRNILEHLPDLKGTKNVLEQASALLGSSQYLMPLRNIVKALSDLGYEKRIFVDLSLARELSYYSGPVFRIYASGTSGQEIGGGGRYDGLLNSYGLDGQAIGFAIDLEEAATLALPPSGSHRVMMWCSTLPPEQALRRAGTILSLGLNGEMSWNKNRNQSYESASSRNCEWWIDLGRETVTQIECGKVMPLSQWMREEYTC
ncbi:ATP phosphoribosyltransferase regulatory subunit [Aminobacterium sp. MB27-C1]|uniref:ATP phosphoribosyltransferase regulatory subunit n=1 Tax=Aminobacterium sp. MB27-C1 TaxID=3070661 RepID=UPI0027DAD143|nr:ATP phosphoribosyltransferase regulatory subunit [Aminobacterium sp. MB27-C1]WMI70566.1 ATP phosphoribosyltransferase regulatory subunit [Aminobacterium sp. MB27-C1]